MTHTQRNRYKSASAGAFVPAQGPGQEIAPRPPDPPPPVYVVDAAPTLAAQEAARETTSGIDRAVALAIRSAPMTAILAILAAGLAWKYDIGAAGALIMFAVVAAIAYLLFNGQEYRHSRAGIERQRIKTAAGLAREQMRADHQLRREIYHHHIRRIEARPAAYLETIDHDPD